MLRQSVISFDLLLVSLGGAFGAPQQYQHPQQAPPQMSQHPRMMCGPYFHPYPNQGQSPSPHPSMSPYPNMSPTLPMSPHTVLGGTLSSGSYPMLPPSPLGHAALPGRVFGKDCVKRLLVIAHCYCYTIRHFIANILTCKALGIVCINLLAYFWFCCGIQYSFKFFFLFH